ncbi:BspA family leucine-rich repeat surface protein [Bombilactobacillus folatiphilus]|uniref:BspA family leucine-rich repeat surface protein n=1 Tax=Bombilactobacillus folatiphilus TaxID=2923362 RepID=A0ABY4P9A3_9LACO|nr:BspA family leucine-rich repeat surface protein [Bombilactobacillus folatiphilus]UQS82325.1 BspA family leucine-rich repeat surface protein [Bombilactobacillus folatiphilus]
MAQGTWGTSKWDYTQDGDDYVLTFHAGTLGSGGIDGNEFKGITNDYHVTKITKIVLDQGVVANEDSSLLFANLYNLKQIIGLENLDTSKVTDMSEMFDGSTLTSLDLSSLDTSNVTDMLFMFQGCKNLQNVNVSSFNTANVADVTAMFMDCISLKELDLNNFNLSGLQEDPFAILDGCGLTSLNLSNLIGKGVELNGTFNLNRLILKNDVNLGGLDQLHNGHIGRTILGTNKKAISNDLVAVSGYQKGGHYSLDELENLTGRDQVTVYEWDTGQLLDDQEVKAITRTINVHQPDGQVHTETQTGKVERTVHYDNNGNATFGDWSDDQFASYQIPKFAGYTASQTQVPAAVISDFNQDQTIDIYYTPIEQTVTIQYLDEAGKEVGTQQLTGLHGTNFSA